MSTAPIQNEATVQARFDNVELFNVFFGAVLQYKKSWSDYLFSERMNSILSLVANSLLAWQVYAGTLQPA